MNIERSNGNKAASSDAEHTTSADKVREQPVAEENIESTIETAQSPEADTEKIAEVKERLSSRTQEEGPQVESEWEKGQRERQEKESALDAVADTKAQRDAVISEADEKASKLINRAGTTAVVIGGAAGLGGVTLGIAASAGWTSFGTLAAQSVALGAPVVAGWVGATALTGGAIAVGGLAIFAAGHTIRALINAAKNKASERAHDREVMDIKKKR